MKALMTVLALVVAVSASASDFFKSKPMPTADSSWEEILNDKRVFVDVPIFRDNKGLVISTLNACYDNDTDSFFSLTQYRKRECLRWENIHNRDREPRCLKYSDYEYYYAQIAAEQTRHVCVKYTRNPDRHECLEYAYKTYRLKRSHDVSVHRRHRETREREARAGAKLFKKAISIPSCQNL